MNFPNEADWSTIDVADWRVPDGRVAVTIAVGSASPTTFSVPACDLMRLMASIGEEMNRVNYAELIAWVGTEFSDPASKDMQTCIGVGLAALWTSLYNPRHGEIVRRQLAQALADRGKAHISWCVCPTLGLALSIGESFADMRAILTRHAEAGGNPFALLWEHGGRRTKQ